MTRRLTPCQANPQAFDLDPENGEPELSIAELQALCMSCPLLAACNTLDTSDLYGVIGGRYRPYPEAIETLKSVGASKFRAALDYLERFLDTAPVGAAMPTLEEACRESGAYRQAVTAAFRQLESQGRITHPRRLQADWVRTVLTPDPTPAEPELAGVC